MASLIASLPWPSLPLAEPVYGQGRDRQGRDCQQLRAASRCARRRLSVHFYVLRDQYPLA